MVIIAFSILTVWGYSLTALMFGGFVFENMHPSFKPKDIAVHQSCLGVSLFELELKKVRWGGSYSDRRGLIRTHPEECEVHRVHPAFFLPEPITSPSTDHRTPLHWQHLRQIRILVLVPGFKSFTVLSRMRLARVGQMYRSLNDLGIFPVQSQSFVSG